MNELLDWNNDIYSNYKSSIFIKNDNEYYHLKCYNKNKRKINENMILSDPDLQNECMYCKKILKEDLYMNTLIDSDDDTYSNYKSSIFIKNDNEYYHLKCYNKKK